MKLLISFSKKNLGISLIEALLSVALVSVGALSLINLQSNFIRSKNEAYQNAQAMILAESKIEELRNYIDITAYDAIANGVDTTNGINAIYIRSWRINNYNTPNYKRVRMTVSWTKQDNTLGIINVTSRISKIYPPNGGLIMENTANNPIPLSPIEEEDDDDD